MRRTIWAGVLAVATLACLAGAPAWAQTRFTGQLGIYSLAVPSGWSELPKQSYADAAFAPGGEASRGSLFVGLQDPQPTLDAEADKAAEGTPSWGRRRLEIDGVPCITLQMGGGGGPQNNFLACHITVQFKDGPSKVLFFMGGASAPSQFSAQTAIFLDAANSVRWGQGIGP